MTYALHHVTIVVNPGGEFGIREMEIRRSISDIEFSQYVLYPLQSSLGILYIYTRFWNWGEHNAPKSPRPNYISALNDTSCAIIHDFRYSGEMRMVVCSM